MIWLWYADRATGAAAYLLLVAAALTGIAYNAPVFGWLHAVARRIHTATSWTALDVLLLHAFLGAVDTAVVATGHAPAPRSGVAYLAVGVGVGLGALVLTVAASLA